MSLNDHIWSSQQLASNHLKIWQKMIHPWIFNKNNHSWFKIFIILIAFKCLLSIEYSQKIYKSGLSKKNTSHWSYSNDLSICISWWFMQLLLNTKYLLYRSHYMTSQQCMLSVELLGNFSVKILHYSSHIYKGSPHSVFSDDLQK